MILKVIRFTVNGEPHSFETAPTFTQLLEFLGLTGKRLAVERNGEIVPRSLHGETLLADGDQLEIVVAVGGG
jgi:sulfur carrier protein